MVARLSLSRFGEVLQMPLCTAAGVARQERVVIHASAQ
jgi:hypothetical protein